MPAFKHTMLTTTPAEMDIISAAIGDDTNQARSELDYGKAVVKGDAQNFVLAPAGAEIEGFIDSVRGDTVNEGYSFGGIQRRKRIIAEVGANQGVTPMAVNDFVVADTQVAFGTKGYAKVKTGAPTKFLWQVLAIEGTGVAGDKVLLERQ